MTYSDTLTAEAASWVISDPKRRAEKFRRERIRHPKLIRDLKLDVLGTEEMDVLEVGGGPLPVSDLLRWRTRIVVDPLASDYSRVIPCPDHLELKIEDLGPRWEFDLVLCTNALDHVQRPTLAMRNMMRVLKPGGYLAVMCAESNAITNPHPAHVHNLTATWLHKYIDYGFETVWELTYAEHGYRYGWVLWEGRRGQPAFAVLARKCSGYS